MGKKKEKDVRFGKFGTVSFTATSKINDFVSYLEEGKVMGTRCNKCNEAFFPPRADCHHCLESDVEWFEIDTPGRLVTFSKMKYGPIGFEDDLPYTIAVVEFDGFRMFGRISDSMPDDDIKIGMTMTVSANPLSNGKMNYVFNGN